jgi:Na+/H+ antiporter NhaA
MSIFINLILFIGFTASLMIMNLAITDKHNEIIELKKEILILETQMSTYDNICKKAYK